MIHSWLEDELADARAEMAKALDRRGAGETAYNFQRGRQQALIDVRSALVERTGHNEPYG